MKRLQVIVLALVALPAVSPATEAALPDLSSPDRWKAFGTERVAVTVKADPGKVRMDFDFGGTAGYALARKDVPLDLPKSWHLSFRLHGTGRRNDLELKLVAREGGSGTIWLEGLAIAEDAVVRPAAGPPIAIASSSASGAGPERLWAQPPSAWHSDPSARGPVMLTLDLRERREWGGLVLFGSGTGRGFGLSRVSVEPVSFGASLNGLFTRLFERDGALTLSIREGTRIPPGGVVFSFPPFAAGASVTVDGAAARAAGNEVVIRRLPAEVVVRNAAARKEKER